MRELYKDTADEIRVFMSDSTDHVTPVTGATVAVTLMKKGQTSFASGGGTVTEAGNGWYIYYATTTDTNTYGPLAVRAVATGADDFNTEFQVKYDNPYAQKDVQVAGILSGAEFSDDMIDQLEYSINYVMVTDLGLTTTRIAKLDNLDAAITSRLASGNVTVGGFASSTVDLTGTMKNSVASYCGLALTSQGYTTDRAPKLDYLTSGLPSIVTYLGEMIDTESEDYAYFTANALMAAPVANVSGLSTFNPATDTVAHVTLVDTTTTNTDMRGTDSAITSLDGIATTTNISDLQTHGDETWPTATGFSTLTAQQVWEYVTRELTSAGSGGATAQEVWEYATRTLSTGGVTAIQTGLATTNQLTEVQNYIEADVVIDTSTTPYTMIFKQKGTETVLGTKLLKKANGDDVTSLGDFWASQTEEV